MLYIPFTFHQAVKFVLHPHVGLTGPHYSLHNKLNASIHTQISCVCKLKLLQPRRKHGLLNITNYQHGQGGHTTISRDNLIYAL